MYATNRRFGIEIEQIGPSSTTISNRCQELGVRVDYLGYTHAATPQWKIVTDNSLSAGGLEIVSPILTAADTDQIRAVCTALADVGSRVNSSCGLHVHVDARDLLRNVNALRRLCKMWVKYESCFDGLVAPSRALNSMCKSNVDGTVEEMFAKLDRARSTREIAAVMSHGQTNGDWGRYHKLNLWSLWRHGTVEFRMHHGSIDANKIIGWTSAVVDFVEAAARTRKVEQTGVGQMAWLLSNYRSAETRSWIKSRHEFFATRAGMQRRAA